MNSDNALNSAAVMMTLGEIAARDGVSKPAVSMKVKRLVAEHGLEVLRDERGRVVKINAAHYDHLRGKVDDPSKDQRPSQPAAVAAQPPSVPTDGGETYNEALRQRTWYEAETKRLALEEQRGALIRADEIAIAVDACASEIVAIVRRLQNETDALAAAVSRDGAHGLRVALKQTETRMLGEIATAMATLAQRPPEPAEDHSPAQ